MTFSCILSLNNNFSIVVLQYTFAGIADPLLSRFRVDSVAVRASG